MRLQLAFLSLFIGFGFPEAEGQQPTRTPQVTVFVSNGQWLSETLPHSTVTTIAGSAQGVPALGDYDGDGLVDNVVFQGTSFAVKLSSNGQSSVTNLGTMGDLSQPGDYDGDGKTDFSVFRPSTGVWYYLPSSNSSSPPVATQTQAVSTDILVPGDYDGDGKTDFAYYRPSQTTFYAMLSSLGFTSTCPMGLAGDKVAVGDYDGDGQTDFSVFRPSTGYWYYRLSSNPNIVRSQVTQGQANDIPVPGDYDGDGKSDFALWRPSTQTWYIILSSNPGTTVVTQLGATLPLTATPVNATLYTKASSANLAIHLPPGSFYTISGNVSTTSGTGVPGVTLTMSGTSPASMLSDSNGNYSFTVAANGSYTITPSVTGNFFAPASQSFPSVSSNPAQNFIETNSLLNPLLPAKEYIYVNGQVVAIEQAQ